MKIDKELSDEEFAAWEKEIGFHDASKPLSAPTAVASWKSDIWELDEENHCLNHIEWDYGIDLERCTTSAEVLDYLCQLYRKNWITQKAFYELFSFVDAFIDPQHNLCSFGRSTEIKDISSILKERYKLRQKDTRKA